MDGGAVSGERMADWWAHLSWSQATFVMLVIGLAVAVLWPKRTPKRGASIRFDTAYRERVPTAPDYYDRTDKRHWFERNTDGFTTGDGHSD